MLASFTKQDITPPPGMKTFTGGRTIVMDEKPQGKIYCRLAVFKDESTSACVICTDLKGIPNELADRIRRRISEKSRIPFDNILLSATHNHTVPDFTEESIEQTTEKIVNSVIEAGKKLKSANKWIFGEVMTEAWGICRRTIYKTRDGRLQVGTQGTRQSDSFAGLDGEDETVLRAMALKSEDDEIIGGIVNYACHPTTMYGRKFYSPDYPGPLCEKLDGTYPSVFIYANGPNGNVAPAGGGTDFCRKMGESLAAKVPEALAAAEDLSARGLRCFSEKIQIQYRKPTAGQVEFANEFLQSKPTKRDEAEFTRRMYGFEYHFKGMPLSISKSLCKQLIDMEQKIKNGMDSISATIQVIAVGELAFIGFPAEMFNQFSQRLRALSPFKYNCIIQRANGSLCYTGPAESMSLGGYECCLGISYLVPEAGELMLNSAVNLLEKAMIRNK